MPLYEYECEACGYFFEKIIFHAGEEVTCPRCGSQVHKLFSPFNVEIPDEVCGKLPRGEEREVCTECRQGGGSCPIAA